MFVTSFAFCVITFEPIEVQTCSAPQNDRQNLGFVKDIKVVVEKMTRNRRKVIGKPGDSLLCRLHSIQVSSLVYSFLYASSSNSALVRILEEKKSTQLRYIKLSMNQT
jgi:hypothetical protein